MKRTMRLPLSACDVDVRLWGRENERARLNKDISCETPPRFARLYDPGRRADGPAGETQTTLHSGGKGGREARLTAERPAATRADLYRLRDRNSDALHSFMCLLRPSSVSGGRSSRPDPFYFSFSRGEIAFTRLHSVSLSASSAFHAISGRGRKSHDAENINERRRRDYDARGRNDLQRARAATSSFLG